MKKLQSKYHITNQANIDYRPGIVFIDYNKIKNMNFDIINKKLGYKETLGLHEEEALKGKSLNESICFLLALNSINYQYWDLLGNKFIRYSNNEKIGALACFEGFLNLWESLKKDTNLYENLNEEIMTYYFGNIPEKLSRIEILKESLNPIKLFRAAFVIEQYLKEGWINTQTAADIAEILPKSFKEPYFKKIQLALYEINLHAQKFNRKSRESLTVAADYQLPKVLEAMEIIKYSKELKERIYQYKLIEVNSLEERAIRAATILSCEEISTHKNITISSLDRFLWLARNDFKDKNFHLTKTTAY